jgi:hypothetical protein
MNKLNLYWPVYKNLEKEFLRIADNVHFDDDQLKVYSLHIADLIVRCAIEIEAISKELYCSIGGNMSLIDDKGNARDLYFDTDCIVFLEQKWKLSKKQVLISATNFYFSEEANKVLTPLHKADKRGTSGSKWKQAYQALKHDRKNSLKKASVKCFLHALGALFILNLYYKDEIFELKDDGNATSFPIGLGSDIFSIKLHNSSTYNINGFNINPDFDECIYLVKHTDEYSNVFKNGMEKLGRNIIETIIKQPKLLEHLVQNNTEELKNNHIKFSWDLLDADDYKNIIRANPQVIRFVKEAKYEAIINKGVIH